MPLIDPLLQELDREAETTRRVLERVPEDRLGWRPHEKSRTLGQLALHVATLPGGVAELAASPPPVQAPTFTDEPSPQSAAQLVPALQESVATARRVLGGMDDAAITATLRIVRGDREVMAVPRIEFLRSIMLNHWYHHRGQLTVYLREIGVLVPAIYGPSADEDPFSLQVLQVISK
ncbi:MAG TPA: DinB family protein [Vicinamibacterales bacterium]|nr:DinB family protein [Vicinamibacterales bacterium]